MYINTMFIKGRSGGTGYATLYHIGNMWQVMVFSMLTCVANQTFSVKRDANFFRQYQANRFIK